MKKIWTPNSRNALREDQETIDSVIEALKKGKKMKKVSKDFGIKKKVKNKNVE